MRGYPLLQLLLVGCLFVAAGLPVWKLTRPVPEEAPTARAAGTEGSPAPAASPDPGGDRVQKIAVTFSSAPTDFRLSYLGKTVLEGRGPEVDFAADASVEVPREGADFAVEARWPAPGAGAKHVAVRVMFKLNARTFEQTVWADADSPMVEIVTVTP